VLLLGGARAGKSALAQRLAQEAGGRVLFVATAEAGDDEMRRRIGAHRASRPAGWVTLEAPLKVAQAIQAAASADVVLVDCLTLLVSNVLMAAPEKGEEAVLAETLALLAAMAGHPGTFIFVSNEVGLGLVPDNPLGRTFRDALGRVNQLVASRVDEVCLVVAGIPLKVKG
jgi:adenosylcobinamide kinase/adenosylcobinamide-phosphate guanylyltransferase